MLIVVPQLLALVRNTQCATTRGRLVAVTTLRNHKHFAGWSLLFDFPEDFGDTMSISPLK
jgi:hypothetical protein